MRVNVMEWGKTDGSVHRSEPGRILPALIASAAFFLGGCTSARLLDAPFDADAVGTPTASPAPNPPADNFTWTVNNHVASTVVPRSTGGQWVRVQAKPSFFPAPNNTRKSALLALSAPLTKTQFRGHLDLNISGSASIILGVMGVHGSPAKYTNLGGAQVSNLAPGPGFSGSVTPNGLDNITGPFALPGVFIGNYTGGQNASIQWSVDQATRTLTVNVFPGGSAQSMTYPATNAGTPTTPLSSVALTLFLVDPTPTAAVFVDNISVEEF
jgi:hypothetical protein